VGLAVLCGHMVLALLLAQALGRRPPAPATTASPGTLVWLSPAPTGADARIAKATPVVNAVAPVEGAAAQPRTGRTATEASESTPTPSPSPNPVAASPDEHTATLRLLPADLPASAPREPLLQTAASRQAIRDAARNPLLSERAALATGIQPTTGAERLAAATGAAAKGDCLKGDFAGGGMGLLSLPFLAVAATTGQCAK
jgi:hypothetical protein